MPVELAIIPAPRRCPLVTAVIVTEQDDVVQELLLLTCVSVQVAHAGQVARIRNRASFFTASTLYQRSSRKTVPAAHLRQGLIALLSSRFAVALPRSPR